MDILELTCDLLGLAEGTDAAEDEGDVQGGGWCGGEGLGLSAGPPGASPQWSGPPLGHWGTLIWLPSPLFWN